jgi:hypothetical protein
MKGDEKERERKEIVCREKELKAGERYICPGQAPMENGLNARQWFG